MIQSRFLRLLLTIVFGLSSLHGNATSICADRLESIHFAIDEQTRADLKVHALADLFSPYLMTVMGRARLVHRLSHPLLDPSEIQRQQAIIRAIADNPEAFVDLRVQLRKIGELSTDLSARLLELEPDSGGLREDIVWAAITWSLLAIPQALKLIHDLSVFFQAIFAGQGAGFGFMNAMKKVTPQRNQLLPFREALVAAKQAQDALTKLPEGEIVDDLLKRLTVLNRGTPLTWTERSWLKVNATFNSSDRDLLDVSAPTATDETALADVNRRVRLLTKSWRMRVPFTERTLPFIDVTTIADKLHVTNFWLRKVKAMMIEHRDELNSILSTLADLEVLLAMGDFYRLHRHRLVFPEILAVDGPTQLVLKAVHPIRLAMQSAEDSVPNDVVLGHPDDLTANEFVVLVAGVNNGTTTYQETAGQAQLMAQNGFPIFADSARLVPGAIITALNLEETLHRQRSLAQAESARVREILKVGEEYRHSFTYLNNPFTTAGERTNISLRLALIRHLIRSRTVGIMSTRSFEFLSRVRMENGLDLLRLQDWHVTPFDFERDQNFLGPEEYYNMLRQSGLDQSIIEEAGRIFEEIRRR